MINLNALWYQDRVPLWPLIPLSMLYSMVVTLRRKLYQSGIFLKQTFPIPVIVVGNLTVGGTGKTPLVIHIIELLKKHHLKPGIVSRGYKGKHLQPTFVTQSSDPNIVGDEALLLAKRTHCPIVVGRDRCAAIKKLIKLHKINVVISDDGLQHYALDRQIEIAVVDGRRRFGNLYCLPVGPMREPENRLNSVDMVVVNGGQSKKNEFGMLYQHGPLYSIADPSKLQTLEDLRGRRIHAVAGIGNPNQFFDYLLSFGLKIIPHAFPDHHSFSAKDLQYSENELIIMTEKDAVKCLPYANHKHWALPINSAIDPLFDIKLLTLLKGLCHG